MMSVALFFITVMSANLRRIGEFAEYLTPFCIFKV